MVKQNIGLNLLYLLDYKVKDVAGSWLHCGWQAIKLWNGETFVWPSIVCIVGYGVKSKKCKGGGKMQASGC